MFVALLSLMLISDPATEVAAAPAPAPSAVPAKELKEKKICRVDEEYTGSRLAKRICLTKSEWEKRRRSEGRD
jgi:hypothetical protein